MELEQIKGFIWIVYDNQDIYVNVNHIIKIEPFARQYEPDATDKCKITLSNEIKPIIVDYSMSHIANMIIEATL